MIYEGWQEFTTERPGRVLGERFVCAAYTREEAQSKLDAFAERQRARGYEADRYFIKDVEPDTDFQVPVPTAARDSYLIESEKAPSEVEGAWSGQDVRIIRRGDGAVVYEFHRNYPSFQPVDIFRQVQPDHRERHFALIAPNYTATTVVDLDNHEIVATEDPHGQGFCPVGFYVPDWWDVHDGTLIPGSHFWSAEDEKPNGQFGFVWGCIWGDDGSWKVQHLDLSRVAEGIIERDERYGYVELATIGVDPKQFIDYLPGDTEDYVRFAVEKRYRLDGKEL